MNQNKNYGYVNWPFHLNVTGEPGTFVYALFLVNKKSDSFQNCHDSSFKFQVPKLLTELYSSEEVLAAVCLGTVNKVFCMEIPWSSEWWQCSFEDLTEDGKSLVKSLENLYQIKAVIVTGLDT